MYMGCRGAGRFHSSKTTLKSTAIQHSVSRASQQCIIVHTLLNFDCFMIVFFVHSTDFFVVTVVVCEHRIIYAV